MATIADVSWVLQESGHGKVNCSVFRDFRGQGTRQVLVRYRWDLQSALNGVVSNTHCLVQLL